MKQLILLLLIAIALTSCSEETIDKEAYITNGVIELVTFSMSENPTEQNKGFSPGYYCYLNLETDSVFIQRKIDMFDKPKIVARAGSISGISKHPAIVAYLEASKQYESGSVITPKTPEGSIYCGLTFYTNYKHAGKERIHYFTSRNLDKRFELFTGYILALIESNELGLVNKFAPEDSVIVPIVNHQSFNLGPMPPPPIRAKVNYTPPLNKR